MLPRPGDVAALVDSGVLGLDLEFSPAVSALAHPLVRRVCHIVSVIGSCGDGVSNRQRHRQLWGPYSVRATASKTDNGGAQTLRLTAFD